MKKLLSMLLALSVTWICAVPALAVEPGQFVAEKLEPSEIQAVELTLISQELTPDGRVDVYSFSIPSDGVYYEAPDFRGEYASGARITLEGAWTPTYAPIEIMLKDLNTGASVNASLECGTARTFALWNDSEWGCYLKADSKNVSGTLTVELF